MMLTRRQFAINTGIISAASVVGIQGAIAATEQPAWYARVTRWGQTNISQKDVADYDVGFWVDYWKRTNTQAVISNGVAGFATFPSRHPLVSSSPFAPDRDLLGEIAKATRAAGLPLASRMDSGVLNPKILDAYSDWRTRDAQGRAGEAMCINSPYRENHVFAVYKEVMDRYRVDGFTDNGGVSGGPLCHCDYCKARWAKEVGGELPRAADLANSRYRTWRRWNVAVTMKAWEQTNTYVREIGGPDCIFVGLVRKFSTLNREIALRAPILMMDCQSRNDSASFQEHVDEGRYMHSILGWDKPVAVAASMTHHSHGYFRLASDPPAEARQYMKAGMAGGFNLWWHHPTAYSVDRRSFDICPSVFAWQARNSQYLGKGEPIATAGIVRSDDNATFFGRDAPGIYQPGSISEVTQVPYRGMVRALVESRIPYYPLNIKDMARHAKNLTALVFPNVGGMSDEECDAVRAYVREGGSVLITGVTSLYDQDGEPRRDFGLADVLGVSLIGSAPDRTAPAIGAAHSYLRLQGTADARHPALQGFDATEVIAYGGVPLALKVAAGRNVLATYAVVGSDGQLSQGEPAAPGIIVGQFGKGRVAYVPFDLDRRYLRDPNPDQAALLGNLLAWCAGGVTTLQIDGHGYVSGYLYRQPNCHVLHLLNGSGVDNGDEIADRTYPVGPLRIRARPPVGFRGKVKLLSSDKLVANRVDGDMVEFEIARLDDHEVVVLE